MVEIWHPMEFNHPSGKIVRVVNIPSGVELFAEDVFCLLGVEVSNLKHDIEINQRYVVVNGELCRADTMPASSIYSLNYTNPKLTRKLGYWVRTDIISTLTENVASTYSPTYKNNNINFTSKESIINYLKYQKSDWAINQEEIVDFYLRFMNKTIPIGCDYPTVQDNQEEQSRIYYLQIIQNVTRDYDGYESLYKKLVLSTTNLLMAQELDLVVFVVLKRLHQTDFPLDVIKQGLVLQALKSVNASRFSYLNCVEPFYLRLLQYLSNEIIA
ncbi:hypothetical protein PN456_05115 [Nodularia spumigena CS-586/05]|uniref:hypothetical protein n=1 Tax=Nodularia spumigena TaxID=70799 RepID=UPI00232B9815|nr:hypothetical protein [Nodularia spumigena]MDB9368339.1 hypothetical protein [Nodularia spumigena CS-586/05]